MCERDDDDVVERRFSGNIETNTRVEFTTSRRYSLGAPLSPAAAHLSAPTNHTRAPFNIQRRIDFLAAISAINVGGSSRAVVALVASAGRRGLVAACTTAG